MTTGRIQRNSDSTWLPHSPGFSLVELLVALTICALLSGAIAAVAPQARAAFDATPEALDLLQRERTVVDGRHGRPRRPIVAGGSEERR